MTRRVNFIKFFNLVLNNFDKKKFAEDTQFKLRYLNGLNTFVE